MDCDVEKSKGHIRLNFFQNLGYSLKYFSMSTLLTIDVRVELRLCKTHPYIFHRSYNFSLIEYGFFQFCNVHMQKNKEKKLWKVEDAHRELTLRTGSCSRRLMYMR